ncbi:hypothetical protein CRE_19215 [Caenorhabditis remanei]|uniref:Uncharacterized protein n=1 Tax=Caenorhabditis remanei TaxID=31234 RepID=E3MJG9_CAERE|nr:hypothetical protein CRE_19215 [Caenorhabditis remanei]
MLSKPIIVLCVFAATAYSITTYEDVLEQSKKSVRCWQPKDAKNLSAGYSISSEKFPFCSYIPTADLTSFTVSGAGEEIEESERRELLRAFGMAGDLYGLTTICFQEAIQVHPAPSPSHVGMRCACKRDGCNVPKAFNAFLAYNEVALPKV